MASTYLSRTPSSTTNRRTWTWSAWVKRGSLSDANQVLFQGIDGGFPEKIQFTASDILEYDHDISGTDYTVFSFGDRRLRDVNAWYHIVVAKDTTQSTETNRIKIYINGEQESLSEYQLGYPPQNYEGAINKNVLHNIGSNNGSEIFNGSMSHIHFIDGTAYDASAFGETDATTGEWKIKTSPSVTYGTNGFFILKDGNTITDSSTNSNNWTLGAGTLTKTEDSPSNVFATLNPLDNYYLGGTFAMGNNRVTTVQNRETFTTSTLAMNSGKWYFETYASSSSYDDRIGISAVPSTSNTYHLGSGAYAYAYSQSDGKIYNNNSGSSYGNNWASTDGKYIGCYLDLDNNKIYFNIDGVVQNSGTGFSITPASSTSSGFYHFAVGEKHSSYYSLFHTNFGNGSFGSTALTGTTYSDNNNQGIFKYNPSGTFDGTTKHFLALSTKGLNL